MQAEEIVRKSQGGYRAWKEEDRKKRELSL